MQQQRQCVESVLFKGCMVSTTTWRWFMETKVSSKQLSSCQPVGWRMSCSQFPRLFRHSREQPHAVASLLVWDNKKAFPGLLGW